MQWNAAIVKKRNSHLGHDSGHAVSEVCAKVRGDLRIGAFHNDLAVDLGVQSGDIFFARLQSIQNLRDNKARAISN